MIDAAPLSFPAGLPVGDAIERFGALPLPFAVVVDEGGRFVGAVTERGLHDLHRRYGDRPLTLAEVADRNHPTAEHGTPRRRRIDQLVAAKLDYLPIVDSARRLLGIDSLHQLLAPPRLDTTVVIMAGGRGTRLHSVTHDRVPKPMVQLGPRPLLDMTIERLAEQGFHRIVLCVHHHARQLIDYFGDGAKWGVEIEYVVEDRPLGTAGGIALIPRLKGPFLVLNGDILTYFEYINIVEAHEASGAIATIGVRPHVHQVPFGVIRATDDNVVRTISEKPVEEVMVNAGIYVISPDAIRRITGDKPRDMVCLLQDLIADGEKVVSYPIGEYWLDIGTPRTYMEAVEEVARRG